MFLSLCVMVIVSLVVLGKSRNAGENITASTANAVDKVEAAQVPLNPFDGVVLEAKAAYVYDLAHDREIWGKNETAQLPLASLTKIVTVLTALASADDPNMIVEITPESLSEEGESGLIVGENWKIGDLAAFTLVVSSNDGAKALDKTTEQRKNVSFVNLMNIFVESLGLKQSYFNNSTGLDISGYVSGGYGSAKDVAKAFAYGLGKFPEVFEKTSRAEETFYSVDGKAHVAKNTNADIFKDVGVIASKTGFTDLAGGNLAVAFDVGPGQPVVIVVLGSTQEGRFNDARVLMEKAREFISNP